LDSFLIGVGLTAVTILSISGTFAAQIAIARRRSAIVWFVYGVLLGPIGPILVWLSPPAVCPLCGTRTRGWLRRCEGCGADTVRAQPGGPLADVVAARIRATAGSHPALLSYQGETAMAMRAAAQAVAPAPVAEPAVAQAQAPSVDAAPTDQPAAASRRIHPQVASSVRDERPGVVAASSSAEPRPPTPERITSIDRRSAAAGRRAAPESPSDVSEPRVLAPTPGPRVLSPEPQAPSPEPQAPSPEPQAPSEEPRTLSPERPAAPILAGDPAPFPNAVAPSDAPAVPRGYAAALGRSDDADRPPARAGADEERAATSLLATGVFTGGTAGLVVGARYAIVRAGPEFQVMGPLDSSPDSVVLRRPLDELDPLCVNDRCIISHRSQPTRALIAMRGIAGLTGEQLETSLRPLARIGVGVS
jgi:hypothetical protein